MQDVPCAWPGCRYTLLARGVWATMDKAQRNAARAEGRLSHAGRGLCNNCYQRAREHGTRTDFPRTRLDGGYSREELVEEWERIYDRDLSVAENCRRHAERIGYKPSSLERRLGRIGWKPLAVRNRMDLAA